MENEIVAVGIPAEGLSRSDLTQALDGLFGAGNYDLTEENKAQGFHDEELGYSPEVNQFIVSVISGVVAKLLSNVIAAEIEKRAKKNHPSDNGDDTK